jgi:hypothetical protein
MPCPIPEPQARNQGVCVPSEAGLAAGIASATAVGFAERSTRARMAANAVSS